VAPPDADLAVAPDLPRVRHGRLAHALGAELDLDLVLEAEDLEILGLDRPPRQVAPCVEQTERAAERGLGRLGPAERGGEVDPVARVRIHPGDARALDVSSPGHAGEGIPTR